MTRVSHESHQVHHARVQSPAQKTWEQQVAHGERHIGKGPHADRHSVEEGARVIFSTEETEKNLKKTATAKRRIEKDILIVAPKQMREEKIQKLAIVKSSDDVFMKYLTTEEESTISILGKMAVLIAQADSNFRQTLWNQSTQTMQMTVAMAPLIANMVKGQWEEQANATREDAAKDEGAGIGMLIAGGVGIGMGAFRGVGEEAEAAEKEASKVGVKDAASEAEANADNALGNEQKALANEEKQAANGGQPAKAEPKAGLLEGWSMKRVSKYLKNIMEGMSSSQMMGQAAIQLNINAPHDRAKADHQQKAGQFDGNAKETEGYQAWGNQVTERSNQGVNAADQNHASTIQTWKSVSDSLTNSLVSAWNKI